MSIITLFRTIRTARQFADKPVPREAVLHLLNDAVWAPNHRLREPWRFIYAEGEAKRRLAEALKEGRHERAARTIAEAPVALVVTARNSTDGHVASDDFAAACCLIQNIQLLGREQGLGMAWELADYSACASLLALAGIRPDERIAGLLALGFFASAAEAPPEPPTRALSDRDIEVR